MSNKIKDGGMHAKRVMGDIITYIFLIVLSVIWLIPFFWLVMQSFRDGKGQFISTFLPKAYTVNNYKALFTQFDVMNFPRMFMNTFFIACCTCVISTFFVLSVAYCTSRLKWKMRKPYMNMAMILNLFPGFMTMIAVYFILKALGMTEGNRIPLALIICFSSGSGTGFFVMKGFMDTIPKALDEAATLDGCTRWQIFTKITLPLSKPMIVYQIITSFMAPWVDFVFAKVICRTNSQYFTVSIGLWSMLEKEYVDAWFVRFCAGAVLVSIPIAILFMIAQKFYQEAMSGAVKGCCPGCPVRCTRKGERPYGNCQATIFRHQQQWAADMGDVLSSGRDAGQKHPAERSAEPGRCQFRAAAGADADLPRSDAVCNAGAAPAGHGDLCCAHLRLFAGGRGRAHVQPAELCAACCRPGGSERTAV